MPAERDTTQPKLLLHKPSPAEVKKFKAKGEISGFARPMDSSSSSPSSAAELAPKKTFLRRVFPFLLAVNFAVGAYVLLRTTQKQSDEKEEEAPVKEKETVPLTTVETSKPEASQQQSILTQIVPKVALPPIAVSEQRELFKWILEEKRRVKPSSPAEKNKLNEEKALLKEFIRAESVPSI
ncbi:uncharacterized protein LOC144709738 [Wolffia australiana]